MAPISIFFVYDSGDRLIYSSGPIPGIIFNERGDKLDLFVSTKKATEYLFDWFVMAYVNGIRLLGHEVDYLRKSGQLRSRVPKGHISCYKKLLKQLGYDEAEQLRSDRAPRY